MLDLAVLLPIIRVVRDFNALVRDIADVPGWKKRLPHIILLEKLVHELKRET